MTSFTLKPYCKIVTGLLILKNRRPRTLTPLTGATTTNRLAEKVETVTLTNRILQDGFQESGRSTTPEV
jgi:hypothetical protein